MYFILSITVSLQEFVVHVIYFCEFTGICISCFLLLWVYRNLYFILSISVSLQQFVFHLIYFCEFTGICISSYLLLWVYSIIARQCSVHVLIASLNTNKSKYLYLSLSSFVIKQRLPNTLNLTDLRRYFVICLLWNV